MVGAFLTDTPVIIIRPITIPGILLTIITDLILIIVPIRSVTTTIHILRIITLRPIIKLLRR